jgi:GAF domain-containing protein
MANLDQFAGKTSYDLGELGSLVLAEETLDSILNRVALIAQRLIPGATDVSVTLVDGAAATTAAHSGALAMVLDERQYEIGYGPCLDAARDGQERHIADMGLETRWPAFAVAAVAAGARSSMSIPLPLRDRVIGSLNIYGTEPAAFGEDSAEQARIFASYAAVALANAQVFATSRTLAAQMEQAMESRAVIEQAKGILMGLRRITSDDAFQVLRTLSQTTNRKLRDVAQMLVDDAANGPDQAPQQV